MKCNRCIHYNVCLGYRNIDYDGDSNSCPYAEERPQGKWIPVSERLPKKDGRYYVTRHNYVTQSDFIDILWYEKGLWWDRQLIEDYAVIAWMPKPEPYKEAEE